MSNERWLQDVQEVISKLKFISKVKIGDKLQVNGLSIIGTSLFEKIFRHYTSKGRTQNEILESREISFNFISEVCEEALKIAHSIIDKNGIYHVEIWKMIITNLKEFQKGIANLMETYETDDRFVARVDTFILILNAKIKELEDTRNRILSQNDIQEL